MGPGGAFGGVRNRTKDQIKHAQHHVTSFQHALTVFLKNAYVGVCYFAGKLKNMRIPHFKSLGCLTQYSHVNKSHSGQFLHFISVVFLKGYSLFTLKSPEPPPLLSSRHSAPILKLALLNFTIGVFNDTSDATCDV